MGIFGHRAGRRVRRAAAAGVMAVGMAAVAAAPAAAYPTNISSIPAQYGVNMMCKTYLSSVYGPVWKLTIAAASNPGKTISVQVWVVQGSTQIDYAAASGRNGSWGSDIAYASASLNHVYYVAASGGEQDGRGVGYGRTGPYSIAAVATC